MLPLVPFLKVTEVILFHHSSSIITEPCVRSKFLMVLIQVLIGLFFSLVRFAVHSLASSEMCAMPVVEKVAKPAPVQLFFSR